MTAIDPKVENWRKASRYLPKFLRDFHDQKDLFKAIHETINVEGHSYAKDVSWVAGQCYTIDIFLWFMAKHGYVLRKTDVKLPFSSLSETVSEVKAVRDKQMAAVLMAGFQSHT